MEDAIKNFPKQFAFNPIIENEEKLPRVDTYIVSGMGGSHLAADLVKSWKPELDIIIHSDYGLPPMGEKRLAGSLFIASSYSGNTEEAIDGLQQALKKGMACAVIATGGAVLKIAQESRIPYIKLPSDGIQPRSALGYSTRALLRILGEEDGLTQTASLVDALKPDAMNERGNQLASALQGFVPIIYASVRNEGIAYSWKIKCNETGKIPAFYNVVPELNHNEMTGFDRNERSFALSKTFYVLMLTDDDDDLRVTKRMEVLRRLYEDRKLPVELMPLRGTERFERIFSSLLVADWTAYHTALLNRADPEQVPMVEEFKKRIATS